MRHNEDTPGLVYPLSLPALQLQLLRQWFLARQAGRLPVRPELWPAQKMMFLVMDTALQSRNRTWEAGLRDPALEAGFFAADAGLADPAPETGLAEPAREALDVGLDVAPAALEAGFVLEAGLVVETGLATFDAGFVCI
jgi:hypothetical protein